MRIVDHLVYASPDLDTGISVIAERLGVRPEPGGRHPDFGTRNALVALGRETYLEIIAPDPDNHPEGPRLFGIDELESPRLATWAARATDLESRVEAARSRGVDLGEVSSGQRRKPDGSILTWRLTEPGLMPGDGIVPFLIDWGDTPSPATDAAPGCRLVDFRAEHPDAERVQAMLDLLKLDLQVGSGPKPKLIATIESPAGTLELY